MDASRERHAPDDPIDPELLGETIHGVTVSDEKVQAWADEAEAGYDVDELRRRVGEKGGDERV